MATLKFQPRPQKPSSEKILKDNIVLLLSTLVYFIEVKSKIGKKSIYIKVQVFTSTYKMILT